MLMPTILMRREFDQSDAGSVYDAILIRTNALDDPFWQEILQRQDQIRVAVILNLLHEIARCHLEHYEPSDLTVDDKEDEADQWAWSELRKHL